MFNFGYKELCIRNVLLFLIVNMVNNLNIYSGVWVNIYLFYKIVY